MARRLPRAPRAQREDGGDPEGRGRQRAGGDDLLEQARSRLVAVPLGLRRCGVGRRCAGTASGRIPLGDRDDPGLGRGVGGQGGDLRCEDADQDGRARAAQGGRAPAPGAVVSGHRKPPAGGAAGAADAPFY
ncbi:hypothetical protein GCM10023222_21470 [Saccharopolyspora cebuensis]